MAETKDRQDSDQSDDQLEQTIVIEELRQKCEQHKIELEAEQEKNKKALEKMKADHEADVKKRLEEQKTDTLNFVRKNIDVDAINKQGSSQSMVTLMLLAFVVLGSLSIYQLYESTLAQDENIEYALGIIKGLEKFEMPMPTINMDSLTVKTSRPTDFTEEQIALAKEAIWNGFVEKTNLHDVAQSIQNEIKKQFGGGWKVLIWPR